MRDPDEMWHWLTALLTIALALLATFAVGWLLRRPRPGRLVVGAGRAGFVFAFQRSSLILTTLMVLSTVVTNEPANSVFYALFWLATSVLLTLAVQRGQAEGRSLFENRYVPAVGFGFLSSLVIGFIGYVCIDSSLIDYLHSR